MAFLSISNMKDKNLDKGMLVRLLEYCKYMYEEEKERTSRIERKINIHTVILGGGLGAIIILPANKFIALISTALTINQTLTILCLVFLTISLLFILLSVVFTILVYKVRNFERLSDPKITSLKSIAYDNEDTLITSFIADYVAATNANHKTNDKKAKSLSNALFCLLMGLIIFAMVSYYLSIFIIVNGG